MRADRLVSLVLLLRQQGQMTAPALAEELEVSTRTVLRDIEALSAAGVPVYAQRGRHGGFTLLPGFRTELTGLNHHEAVALLATSAHAGQNLGLSAGLTSAVRKVVDAVPDAYLARASEAARRFLIEPNADLLARRQEADAVPAAVMSLVREAVVAGRQLSLDYTSGDGTRTKPTVDPIGLVTARGKHYLLATRSGADRTYRLSRIAAADVLATAADRSEEVDLPRLWKERSTRFRAGGELVQVSLRVDPAHKADLLDTAVSVLAESGRTSEVDDWLDFDVTFQDARHARWALWSLGCGAEARSPQWLRDWLHERAMALATRYERGADAGDT